MVDEIVQKKEEEKNGIYCIHGHMGTDRPSVPPPPGPLALTLSSQVLA